MRAWTTLLSCLLLAALSACSSAPLAPPTGVLDDALFAPASERIDAAEVFSASDAMRRYLEVDLAAAVRSKGPRAALVDALYSRQLKLDYDATGTRNAAEAFDARMGNCMSLVLMTATLAKQLGLPVQYHSVYVQESWGRSGDLLVVSGHVNLTLNHRMGDQRFRFDAVEALSIDFDPPAPGQRQHSRVISESTIVAMFMNNRAAEALAAGRLDDAYGWARAAVRHEPIFMPAYNTLGVIYQRRGASAQAERVLAQLLEREPANTLALSNLARVYDSQGRQAEAQALQQRLAAIEPSPPFHYFHLGVAALERRDYAAARELFRKEVARAAYYHEFHFGLALAHFGLGELTEARKQMALAMESSTRRGDRELYAGKLERMKAQRLQ